MPGNDAYTTAALDSQAAVTIPDSPEAQGDSRERGGVGGTGDIQQRNDPEKKSNLRSRNRSKRQRDTWDRVGTVAPLAQALALALIGLIGAWWTASYNTGQLKLQKLKTVEVFFSHLLSTDEREKQIALVTLGAVDGKLAADLSATLGRGGIAALGDLAQSPNPTAAAAAVEALKVANVSTVALSKGRKVKLKVAIGYGLPGQFRISLWHDASARFLPLGEGTNVDESPDEFDLGAAVLLDQRLLRWNIVVMPTAAERQYAATVTITQDDKPVPGGTFKYSGALDGAQKVVVDTVRLGVS